MKYLSLALCLFTLMSLTACESDTAKQWQRVFNDTAHNTGKRMGD